MIRNSARFLVGVMLTGCTFNNFQSGSFTTDYTLVHRETTVVDIPAREEMVPTQPPALLAPPHPHIRFECGAYVPLTVPAPVKIDLKELEAAASSKEINAITLRNIKEMRQQMLDYKDRQQKHYAEYVRRCVVR
jgi:hypothetical protein